MLITKLEGADIIIYGKTGMGMADGIVVDAWFTGFAETAEGNLYFCVRLGRTDSMNVASSSAKEIAIQLVSDYSWQIMFCSEGSDGFSGKSTFIHQWCVDKYTALSLPGISMVKICTVRTGMRFCVEKKCNIR